MRRYLAVYVPRWPVQCLRRTQPEARGQPVVLFERSARGVAVRVCSQEANALGVHVGMSLADAKALSTELLLYELNLSECQVALEELCLWATRFSPLTGVEPVGPHASFPEALLLDVTGCASVFGGEEKLLNLAVSSFNKHGYKIRAAIASTLGAAWALTHYGKPTVIAPDAPDKLKTLLEPLPLASLRLSDDVLGDLRPLGLHRIGDVLRQPRSSLPSRFGEELLRRLDQALGQVPETLMTLRPEPEFSVARSFEYPVRSSEMLFTILQSMVKTLADELKSAQRGALHVECWLHHEIAQPVCVGIALHRSSHSPKHLWRLLHARLEDHFRTPMKAIAGRFKRKHRLVDTAKSLVIEAEESIEAVALHVTASEGVTDQQLPLFERARDDGSSGELNLLLDRLVTRLGAASVRRVGVADDHLPERCFNLRALAERAPAIDNVEAVEAPRPIRLLPRPLPAQVVWPSSIACEGQRHAIQNVTGPERIESGWWRERDQRRDYYIVEVESGARYWLFEDLLQHRWFVHGSFD